MRTQPTPCHDCELSDDCTLDDCTPAEWEHAFAATRRVRDEQGRLLAALLPERRERAS
jgi:hypothetical protein